MLTYALMTILILAIVASVLYGTKIDKNKNSFMSIDDTNFLRGFWCVIVVLVHIPAAYQNRLQDMLGSFAYIGVTFFFMASAYGLKYSMIHKKGYMDHFWRRRLPAILVPAFFANVFNIMIKGVKEGFGGISVINFININNWVKVLLLYYLFFWFIYNLAPKFIKGEGYWQDITMCLFVAACSLIDYLTSIKITSIWIVEPIGFAYGIIAATYSDQFKKWIKGNWLHKCGIFMVLSVFLGIAYLKMKSIEFFGDYLLKIVLGIAITAFIFEMMSKLRIGNRVNSFLGGVSYEVFLLHNSVFVLLTMIAGSIDSGVFVISAVIITVALAFVLNKICLPIIKLFR